MRPSAPVRVGLIGCGNISRTYLTNIAASTALSVVACADIDGDRARETAIAFHIPLVLTVEELFARQDVDLVLNLTIPSVHAAVTSVALRSGKHVYSEKPIATRVLDGQEIVRLARQEGRVVGVAPDTFMGSGMRTCRRLIREGAIGRPVAFNAAVMNAGPEWFHPGPEFLFLPGAGPMMDIGPYYVTALIELLGTVSNAVGRAGLPRAERTVLTGDRVGTRFPVQTPTHVAGLLEFDSGVVGTLTASFDVVDTRMPPLEIYGTEGTILAPRPNSWSGPVRLSRGGRHGEEVDIDEPDGYLGMGLVDMAESLIAGRAPAADATRALHVLEVLSWICDGRADGDQGMVLST